MRAMRLRPGPGKQVIKTKVWLRVVFFKFVQLQDLQVLWFNYPILPFDKFLIPRGNARLSFLTMKAGGSELPFQVPTSCGAICLITSNVWPTEGWVSSELLVGHAWGTVHDWFVNCCQLFWYQSGVANFGSGLQYLLWQCLPDPWWSVYCKSMRQRCHVFVMSKSSSYKPHFFSFKPVSPTIFCWYRTRPQVLIACVGSLRTHRFLVLRWTGFDDVPLVPNLRSCYFNGMNPSHTAIRGNSLKFSVVMAVSLKRCHGLNWSVQIPKQSYIESSHVYNVPHCSTNQGISWAPWRRVWIFDIPRRWISTTMVAFRS